MTGQILTGVDLTADVDASCDVCIVGSGAGGSVLAAGLAERGLRVVMLEEGGYHSRKDFVGQEGIAYPALYQDRGTRASSDLGITILQGRTVGGGTTVNWTTCFRTPERILANWASVHGVAGADVESMAPHFEAVEARLNISQWPEELVNANNHVLLDGARKLGWEANILRRNVKGCANSGYCGMGCPYDAKQAMHLTYLPDAVGAGMTLYANARVDRLEVSGGRVAVVHATVLEPERDHPTGVKITVRPKVTVVSAGAINSPALLIRSGITQGPVGRRTMLHPVVAVSGWYDPPIEGWKGAPQSVSSHQHVDRGPDKVGFFLETAPMHPMLGSTAVPVFGEAQARFLRELGSISTVIAVCVDGLVPGDDGGVVTVRSDGRPNVDYLVRPELAEAWKAAHVAMAQVHFAAGARKVGTMHVDEDVILGSEAEIPRLDDLRYGALRHTAFSAHQMGGCCMGGSPEMSVVDSQLRHWAIGNLFVVDGSVFPSGLGVNPSESIYGFAHRARDAVASAV
jgi:choline dehydrogenase-like flavoprotein